MTLVSLWTLVTSKRKSRKLTKHWSYYEKPLKTHVVSNVLFKLRALKMIEEELKSLPSREPVNTELQGGIMSLVWTLFNLWRNREHHETRKKRKGSYQMKWNGMDDDGLWALFSYFPLYQFHAFDDLGLRIFASLGPPGFNHFSSSLIKKEIF